MNKDELQMLDKHHKLSVNWIKEKCMPFIQEELNRIQPKKCSQDYFEQSILAYQLITLILSSCYIYEWDYRLFDYNLIVLSSLIISRKQILKKFIRYSSSIKLNEADITSQQKKSLQKDLILEDESLTATLNKNEFTFEVLE